MKQSISYGYGVNTYKISNKLNITTYFIIKLYSVQYTSLVVP